MSRNLNQRLRTVDQRLAAINRRLGYLQGRLYFKPSVSKEWQEVPIFALDDGGVSPKNTATGEEISARRYSAKVNRDWLDAHRGEIGSWAIQTAEGEELIKCEKENERVSDMDTFGELDFRITQEINLKVGPPRS